MKVFAAPILMAPMAGVTDAAFRARLKRNGCRAMWTDMISAAAMVRNHRNTLKMATPHECDGDTAVQLFGAKPSELGLAAQELTRLGWRRIDLNMGCPVKKVVKSGSGAALMRNATLAKECMSAVRENTDAIFTVKIRLGWNAPEENYLEIGGLAQEAGVDGVIIHGRTRSQLYGGEADWGQIGMLAKSLAIPVAGNGDIRSAAGAVERLEKEPVSAVMIGRAALEKPWLFRDAALLLDGQCVLGAPSPQEVAEDLGLQLADMLKLKSERAAVAEMKKFVAWALKGFEGAAALRKTVMTIDSAGGMEEMLEMISNLSHIGADAPSGGAA